MKKIRTSIRFNEQTRRLIAVLEEKTHRNMSQVIEEAIWKLAEDLRIPYKQPSEALAKLTEELEKEIEDLKKDDIKEI